MHRTGYESVMWHIVQRTAARALRRAGARRVVDRWLAGLGVAVFAPVD